ncbi:MAG TPA: molybdate ABC transporter substrate-binding protein [Candidatus Acidoferrales bacterium]|nr:molybdate ABC transporter substrate-binding protein [Candidatus Acidoferrales bacterium]
MKRGRFVWAMLLAVVLATCSFAPAIAPTAAAAASEEITVSAAVSLKDALDEISNLYQRQKPDTKLRFNLGGSGALMRQIEQGAPVDVFISASPDEMNALAMKGMLLEGTRRDLLKNRIVLIVPVGTSGVETFQDLDKQEVKRIGIGEPQTVPAGTYAQQVLTHLGIYDRLKPKLILGKDVRQVLTYVASGNVDAGIVYATDAKVSDKVRVVASAQEDWHSPVIYPVAVLKDSKHAAAAKNFEAFLSGPAAKPAFEKYGFVPAGK